MFNIVNQLTGLKKARGIKILPEGNFNEGA